MSLKLAHVISDVESQMLWHLSCSNLPKVMLILQPINTNLFVHRLGGLLVKDLQFLVVRHFNVEDI